MTKSSSGWFKLLFILMSVVYIIAGFSFIMNPGISSLMLTSFIGWLAIVYGIMMIVSYFMSAHFKSVFALIMGIVVLVVGIVIVSNLFNAANVMGVVVGIAFLVAGCYKTYQSFQLKSFGFSSWWAVLISGICGLIIGCLMVFNPSVSGQLLAIYVGTNFLITGASDLVLAITLL